MRVEMELRKKVINEKTANFLEQREAGCAGLTH